MRLISATILGCIVALGGCGADPLESLPPDAGDSGTDVVGGGADAAACLSSTDCAGGALCVADECVPCATDDACVADDAYGVGAMCDEGACLRCTSGEEDCGCLENGQCELGLRCDVDVCVPCELGEEQCGCDGGVCDDGLACVEEVCVQEDCAPGTEGCACDADDACDEGLTCFDNGLCGVCTADIEGCPCDFGECTNDLVCDDEDDLCRAALACDEIGCAENQRCEDALSGQDAACLADCEDGYVWNADTSACDAFVPATCEESPDVADGCADAFRTCVDGDDGPTCGDCLAFYADDGGDCVELTACGVLSATCQDENRGCVERTETTGASCGDCLVGFDDLEGVCVAGEAATCGDGDGSIAADCAALNRSCVSEPSPQCGGCLDGFDEAFPGDLGGACVASGLSCSMIVCADAEYCVEGEGGEDASCAPVPCPEGEAFSEWTDECVSCGSGCAEIEGLTGREWPFTQSDSTRCLCETEEGYYYSTSGTATARRCDDDGDGWVSDAALAAVESDDPHVRANARCDVSYVEYFELRNEYGQALSLQVCAGGGFAESCASPVRAALVESNDLDRQSELENRIEEDPTSFPTYGPEGASRTLNARELNPLTRLCVTPEADYNYNGMPDVSEGHDGLSGHFGDMTYFAELHRGWFEPYDGTPGAGVYVIEERSRCEDTFPLTYEGTTAASGEPWRRDYHMDCVRNRRGDYDADAESLTGFDFAHWGCAEASGTCTLAPPLVTGSAPDGSTQPDPHGLCDGGVFEDDGIWRGMNHHSQFRCAVLSETAVSVRPEVMTEAQVDDLGWLNACELTTEAPNLVWGEDNPYPTLPSSVSPEFECELDISPTPGVTAGFVVVGYRPGLNYEAGCIDEWASPQTDAEKDDWRGLCDGYDPGRPDREIGFGASDAFGEMICGCAAELGGVGCEWRCDRESLHLGGGILDPAECVALPDWYLFNGFCTVGEDGQRDGYWLCAESTASIPTDGAGLFEADDPDTGFALYGGVPTDGIVRTQLCETMDGDGCSGYSIR